MSTGIMVDVPSGQPVPVQRPDNLIAIHTPICPNTAGDKPARCWQFNPAHPELPVAALILNKEWRRARCVDFSSAGHLG